MSSRKACLTTLSLLTPLLVWLGTAEAASVSTCTTDQDCAAGFACGVAPVPTTPPKRSCAPDADCTSTAPDDSPANPIRTCAPKFCASNADCGGEMVCDLHESTSCSTGGATCEKGATCPPPPPPVCTTTSSGVCAYRWQLPCKADSDCGDSFACQPTITTACSGSSSGPGTGAATGSSTGIGGSGGGSGGSASSGSGSSGNTGSGGSRTPVSGGTGNVGGSTTDPTPPDASGESCTTSTSFPGTCQPRTPSCATDADCPALWTCQELGATDVAVSEPAGAGATGGSIRSSAPVTKICVSPFGGYGTASGGDKRGGSDSGQTLTGNDGSGATGGTPPPTNPTASGGTTGHTATSGENLEAADASGGGGCAMTASATPTAWATLMLAFVGLTARRRSRR